MHGINPSQTATIAGTGFIALDLLLSDTQHLRVRRRLGGTCGNVLAVLSFLGFKTVPIARLGTDQAADVLISDLQSVGVDCSHVRRDPTARTPRVVELVPSRSGNRHRYVFKCPMCQRRLPKRSEPIYEQAVLSLQQMAPKLFFFDRAGASTVRLASEAHRSGAIVMFEPDSFKTNDRFARALQVSDIVKYSGRRAEQPIDPWIHRVDARPRLVVETLGGGGLRYMIRTSGESGTTWKYQRPFAANSTVDQAGAGDWCSAGLIMRILMNGASNRWRERTISRALAFGQALAAASIRFRGPRGYLESTSQRLVGKAALSTIRLGRVPDWIVQDQELSTWPLSEDGRKGYCALCLEPARDKEESYTSQ